MKNTVQTDKKILVIKDWGHADDKQEIGQHN